MRFFRYSQPAIVIALALLLALPVYAAMTPGSGILGSKHEFSGGSGKACAFCHMPSKGGRISLMWGQAQSSSYYWSDSRYTSAGTRLAGVGQNGARPSALCLSCHDGTVAPGDKSIRGEFAGARGAAVSFAGNLEGNHPVSVPYPAGGMDNIYNGVTTGSALNARHYVSDPTRLGIVLYRDNGDGTVSSVEDGATGGSFGIECSSCHDVHNGPAVQDKLLLRGKLAGAGADYICVKCHML